MKDIVMRKVKDSDRNEIIDIFNYYVKEGFAAYPDSPVPPEFYNALVDSIHACFVVEKNRWVKGFSILRPFLPFSTFAKTATVSTFIEPDSRRMGYGKMLLTQVENEARSRKISLILASISSENKESQLFHVKNGFCECGRFHRAGLKLDTPFDLVWMEKELI